ncbi:MAG: hypothetical protein EHM20_15590 [Alphaproteobacteria bacterium]|nr:MAG: hypothetical protein EHM20_15590 [Alphaproteobacteria bacterium]
MKVWKRKASDVMALWWMNIMSKKTIIKLLVVFFLFLLPIGYFLSEWCFAAGGIKILYYNFWKYDKNKVRVVEDCNFIFYKEGYSKTYTLNSGYYVART